MTDTDTSIITDPDVVDAELVEDAESTDETDATMVEGANDGEEDSSPDEAQAEKPRARSRRGKGKAEDKAPGKEVEKAADAKAPAKADPAAESSFTKAQANRLTSKLKGNLRTSAELIMEAYDGRIWVALQYESWEDYLNSELGEYRIKLPAVERKELVAKMSAAKSKGGSAMSSRAIASALGVDQKTVVNDRKELGLIKIPDAERADGETEDKVVGMDGREQAASRPSAPRIVSLVDKFTTHFVPVDSHLQDLLGLTTDERWADEAAEVAKRHRADLRRAASTLAEIIKALPGNAD